MTEKLNIEIKRKMNDRDKQKQRMHMYKENKRNENRAVRNDKTQIRYRNIKESYSITSL